jgi:folate-binding protein YgfZ
MRGGLGLQRNLLSLGLAEDVNEPLYKTLRFAFGIPEGPKEIPRTQAIPLEYNVDLMGGISYTKGCYLGQELVARTHHRGVIRKRIMPVIIGKEQKVFTEQLDSSEALEADIIPEGGTEKDRIGTVISAHGNLGMALVRLEAWRPEGSYRTANTAALPIRPVVPHWWPSSTFTTNPT